MKTQKPKKSKKSTDVFLRHQIRIAQDTLKMHDLGAKLMGGMTKDEARDLLKKHGVPFTEEPEKEVEFISCREVRRVPADWQHPKDAEGNDVPLFSEFPYEPSEIPEGIAEGWLKNEPPHYGVPMMPTWPEGQATHFQMYETTSEGSPISPVFPKVEQLALWLAFNNIPTWADQTATYSQWLKIIEASLAKTQS
jgi:hypothetical protein